nr:ATP-binding cassette domain-containing protein [Psychrosphaera sp. F3M07]
MTEVFNSMLECTSLVKRYGQQEVIKLFNHRFSARITKVTGANGSGKSTLLRMLAGLELPDEGQIHSAVPLSELVSLSSDSIIPPEFLTIAEITSLFERYSSFNLNYYHQLIEQLNLKEFEYKKFVNLSTGTKKKFSVIWALSQKSGVLILDEPFASLDQDSHVTVKNIIEADSRILIFVDHENILEFDESINV